MSFNGIEIKSEYRSLTDNIVLDFYIPLLKESIEYKRAVGFFSSSALVEISKGISQLVKNKGKIKLIASPHLSEEDFEAMKKGYESREAIIRNALQRTLKEPKDDNEKYSLNLLANLIADNILDIKIAFTDKGMYHEKVGILTDEYGNKVAFSGSMNESMTAMYSNYESIDVFCSWKSDFEVEKIKLKETAFDSIWGNIEPGVTTVEVPEFKDRIVREYKISDINYEEDIDFLENKIYEKEETYEQEKIPMVPRWLKLHEYQEKAIENWESSNYIGIFDMATGTGKTLTGLSALELLSRRLNHNLATIIVCPYQHLVEQWVEDIREFNIEPIIGYSGSSTRNYKRKLKNTIYDYNLGIKPFFCFVCTNATFASSKVQGYINSLKREALLIVDEAHNFGASNISKTLTDKFKYRIALSATLERHHDTEGTDKLKKYFGEKSIEYTLEMAIREGYLTPYYYHPIIVTLSDIELEKYNELTNQIKRHITVGKDKKTRLSETGKMLAIKRSRVVAGAIGKIEKLCEEIEQFKDSSHMLVYCGATKLWDDIYDFNEDVRQIDAITRVLGNRLDMKVARFTSTENKEQRENRKRRFSEGDIQALVAIKCLDEGVNIPSIKTAFILASSTNPKEYIQRRGRVLRTAKGKDFARIYDFITLPRSLEEVSSLTLSELQGDKSLIKNELQRMSEFNRLSLNPQDSDEIIEEINLAYEVIYRDEEATI